MRTSTRTALERVAAQRDVVDTLDDGTATPPPWTAPDDATAVPRPDREPAHHGRLVLVAAVTAAVALGAATVVATHDAPTPAPTPPAAQQPPTSTLGRLAGAALTQPPPAGGAYSYVHTVGWYPASSSLEGGPAFDVHTARSDRQVWLTDAGAGRILRVAADGDPSTTFDDSVGVNPADPAPTAQPDAPAPGGDTASTLLARFPDRTGAQWLTGMVDTWNGRAVDPSTQAALLTILAGRGDVTVGGEVLDRAGRTGIGVSAEDDTTFGPLRRTLLLDPTTGALLAAQDEQLAPSLADATGPFPEVVGYTVFLASGRTADTSTTVAVAPPVLGDPAPALRCPGGSAVGLAVPSAAGATGDLLPQEAAEDLVVADPSLGAPHQWHTSAGPAAGELTLSNGTALLTVVRLADGTWAVTGGSRCG